MCLYVCSYLHNNPRVQRAITLTVSVAMSVAVAVAVTVAGAINVITATLTGGTAVAVPPAAFMWASCIPYPHPRRYSLHAKNLQDNKFLCRTHLKVLLCSGNPYIYMFGRLPEANHMNGPPSYFADRPHAHPERLFLAARSH